MPKDIRRLVFNYEEVTKALRGYGQEQNIEIPGGKVVKITITDSEEDTPPSYNNQHSSFMQNYNVATSKLAAIVTFFNPASPDKKNLYLTTNTEFLTAALIDYCVKDPDIKIPKAGKKNVTRTEFNICLDIYLDSTSGESAVDSFEFDE